MTVYDRISQKHCCFNDKADTRAKNDKMSQLNRHSSVIFLTRQFSNRESMKNKKLFLRTKTCVFSPVI